MIPSDERTVRVQFASEHAKRARHMSEAEERQRAMNLMRNLSDFEWYRNQFTPAARMAHERELLATLEAYYHWPARRG